MVSIEQLVRSGILLGLLGFAFHYWCSGVRGAHLACCLWTSFYSLILVLMMSAHTIEIVINTAYGSQSLTGEAFSYNWRVYSLLLFGALLIWLGVRSLSAAIQLGRATEPARGTLLRSSGLVLLLVAPTIPIHAFFGVLISGLSLLTMGVAWASAWSAASEPAGRVVIAPSA